MISQSDRLLATESSLAFQDGQLPLLRDPLSKSAIRSTGTLTIPLTMQSKQEPKRMPTPTGIVAAASLKQVHECSFNGGTVLTVTYRSSAAWEMRVKRPTFTYSTRRIDSQFRMVPLEMPR
ncbi:MAG: hypothetical protein ABJA98_17620 [Acidobacteriota bacterium]